MTTLIPKYDQGATGAVSRAINFKLEESVSVKDFGAVGDGATDDTAAFQAAIEAMQLSAKPIYIPAGTYLITNTLTVYNGTQIIGDTNFYYGGGYGRPPYATTINFRPSTALPLFNYVWKTAPAPTFIFHTSIQNLYCTGNSNATYGLKLNAVIYSAYKNLIFEGFSVGIYCTETIDNHFENILIPSGVTACVEYAGNAETTDVWDNCIFNSAPIGVKFDGSSVAIRFNNCLWEQIASYGMDIHSKCQSITVNNGYSEDVPYGASPVADAAMFRVGYATGSSASDIQNHLNIIGGTFNGRNAGVSGDLLNVNYCWGILATGFTANRWDYIVNTSTNTEPNSIALAGYQGISWINNISDITKINGFFANGVLNTGSYSASARFANINATYAITTGPNGFYNYGSVAWASGSGSPEGSFAAVVGSLWSRTDGGAGTSLYVKESGTGNTGWVGK